LVKRILIIDDEPMIIESVSHSLKQEGYATLTASDGETGLRLALDEEPDLILLDLMLPGLNGMEVCRQIRKTSETPIIMLTAKEGEVDRVLGLELGADDYVVKPFSMREVLTRIKSVLKRFAVDPKTVATTNLTSGDLVIDLLGHEVTIKGRKVDVSIKEFDLLRILAQHPGQVLTREQLLNLVWNIDFCSGNRTVDVHIRWLREKIEDNPQAPRYILTIRGVGYKFRK
jgi:DNA-binding response OmpR family regulator